MLMKLLVKNRKSQIAMSDLFLAASIFIILLGAVVYLYSHYTTKFESRQEFNRMQLSAIQITDMLVKSPGKPSNWESDEPDTPKLEIMGLAYSDAGKRNLSVLKVNAFLNLSYDKTRDILGTEHDFYFRLSTLGGSVIAEKGLNATGARAVSIERRVLYAGQSAILSFVLRE